MGFLLFKVRVEVNFLLFLLLQMDGCVQHVPCASGTPWGSVPGAAFGENPPRLCPGTCSWLCVPVCSLQVNQKPAPAVIKAFFPVCSSLVQTMAVSWEPAGVISAGEEMGMRELS